MRREAQCASTLEIAQFLAAHPSVERVRYPGLPADPGHALAARQMDDFGTIVSSLVAPLGGERIVMQDVRRC